MLQHILPPIYDEDSVVLILGSFPSVKSREKLFYYAHPQNRFWRVLSAIYQEEIIDDIEFKKDFLKRHKIALFDVVSSCNVKGSSDTSIKNVVPNDLSIILKNSKVKKIYVNGKTAYNLYNKFIRDKIGIDAVYLPSTSPANAKFGLFELVEAYKDIQKVSKD